MTRGVRIPALVFRAAPAARIRCVAIPHPFTPPARFTTADLLLTAATQTTLALLLSRCPRLLTVGG